MKTFIDFAMNENDKRLLIVLLFILVFLFLIIGLIGALIRFVTIRFGKRMDYELHEVLIYRVISTPEQLKKYGNIKNNRYLVRKCTPPFLIAFLSLIVWIAYSVVYGQWARDYFKEFSTLLFTFDWGNPDNFVNFWGLNLLAKWPDLLNSPTWYNEYWGSYILVPLWLVAISWYVVVIQAYLARWSRVNKLSHSVFEQGLDNFNYYDDMKKGNPLPPNPPQNSNIPH